MIVSLSTPVDNDNDDHAGIRSVVCQTLASTTIQRPSTSATTISVAPAPAELLAEMERNHDYNNELAGLTVKTFADLEGSPVGAAAIAVAIAPQISACSEVDGDRESVDEDMDAEVGS